MPTLIPFPSVSSLRCPRIRLVALAVACCFGAALTAAEDGAKRSAREELAALAPQIGALSRCFTLVHEVVAPSTVSIHTRERVVRPAGWGVDAAVGEVEVGEGSGFIFRSDDTASWVLTNAHVVLQTNHEQDFVRGRNHQPVGYDRLVVQLSDNRDVEAEYVGFDLATDLAVLKIAAPRLPAIEWADSDKVHVGDWVLALGYPLGVGYSATSGIVSATDRSTGIYRAMGALESFIQTDAAINPGNSGGPLVGIDGRLIGVNSNIVSKTGANVGIGFAIPSNLARRVAEDLVAHGRVRWPGIGVNLDELAGEQAKELGLRQLAHVRVTDVLPATPAAEAGLQRNDLVLAINHSPIRTMMNFRARVATCRIGEVMRLRIWRTGKELEIAVTPIDRDEILKARARGQDVELKGFGLRVGIDDAPGLVITEITPESPAAVGGFVPGDRLLRERAIGDLRSIDDAEALNQRRELIVQVLRDGRAAWVRMRR